MSAAGRSGSVPPQTQPKLADGPEKTGSGSDPTGMFAGEREEDRHEERIVRRILDDALPGEPGNWKESGADPHPDPPEFASR